jgi:hypothetical protein
MDIDVERDSTIFQTTFLQRIGNGGSPKKVKNWKITLEFQTEIDQESKLRRVIHVTNGLKRMASRMPFIRVVPREQTFSSLCWDVKVFLFDF